MNSEPRFKSESYRPSTEHCCAPREGFHHCDSAEKDDSAEPCWGAVELSIQEGGYDKYICRGHEDFTSDGNCNYKTEPGFVAPTGALASYYIGHMVFPPDATIEKAVMSHSRAKKHYEHMTDIYSELIQQIKQRNEAK